MSTKSDLKPVPVRASAAVTRRDSATTLLRKLGVRSEHYDRFIRHEGGLYHVDLAAAVAFMTPARVKQAKAREAKAMVKAEAKAAKGPTVTAVATGLILAGKTNAEVWAALVEQFDLDPAKRSYPAWYRGQLRRRGELPANVPQK